MKKYKIHKVSDVVALENRDLAINATQAFGITTMAGVILLHEGLLNGLNINISFVNDMITSVGGLLTGVGLIGGSVSLYDVYSANKEIKENIEVEENKNKSR